MAKKHEQQRQAPVDTASLSQPDVDATQSRDPVIVVGGSKTISRSRTGMRRRMFVWGVPLVLILVIIAVALGLVWRNHTENQNTTATKQAEVAAEYKKQLASEVTTAQKAVKAEAIDATAKQRAERYITLAAAYMNVDQPNKAIEAYNEALKIDPSTEQQVLGGLMYAYAAAGKRDEAIKTGNTLLAKLKSQQGDQTVSSTYISGITNDLNRLKSGKDL